MMRWTAMRRSVAVTRDAGGRAGLAVAAEDLVDARLFRDDVVDGLRLLDDFLCGRHALEHVFRRRALDIGQLRRGRDVATPWRITGIAHGDVVPAWPHSLLTAPARSPRRHSRGFVTRRPSSSRSRK